MTMQSEIKPLSSKAQGLKLGVYRHFKGDLYRVLGVGRLSEDPDQEFVVYQSVKLGTIWLRPLDMFCEDVDRDGYKGPRFKFIESES